MSVRQDLRQTLPNDKEYRHAYADEILNLMVCTQMKVIREQLSKTQEDIAKELDTTQTVISRLENVNYSAWNIRTLKKLAKAFDMRLRITFEGFGTLWKDVRSLNQESLERPTIDKDPEFDEKLGENNVVYMPKWATPTPATPSNRQRNVRVTEGPQLTLSFDDNPQAVAQDRPTAATIAS
jgi:transcriptional regulator with XRE-family HTH domain